MADLLLRCLIQLIHARHCDVGIWHHLLMGALSGSSMNVDSMCGLLCLSIKPLSMHEANIKCHDSLSRLVHKPDLE